MSARRIHNSSSSPTTRRKTKSLSEIINEQFDKGSRDVGAEDDWDLGGRADEYDDAPHAPHDEEDLSLEAEGLHAQSSAGLKATKRPRSKGKETSTVSQAGGARETKRLRRRGPLDAALSEGPYAARPVDALMDDIFGALEAGEDDEDDYDDDDNEYNEYEEYEDDEGEGEDDDEEGVGHGGRDTQKTKKKARAVQSKSRETEAEYTARLEKRLAARRGHGRSENDILSQLEDIRAAQLKVLPSSADTQANGAVDGDSVAKERERAQAAVRHYVMLYSQLLRVRIRLQPAIARAAALPQYYAMNTFVTNAGDTATEAQRDVTSALTDLLGTLHNLTRTGQPTDTRGEGLSFRAVDASHRRIMRQVDTCVEYWGSRLAQPKATGLHTVAQPLLEQIRSVLTGRARLRAKVQKNRSHVRILGHPEHYRAEKCPEGKAARALHIADGDVDEELYDDGEFLREVVKRGGVARLEQMLQDVQHEMRADEAPEKRGFHRMTKGKAINYEPRPKLVGFLVPVPYALSGQYEAMMASLFQ